MKKFDFNLETSTFVNPLILFYTNYLIIYTEVSIFLAFYRQNIIPMWKFFFAFTFTSSFDHRSIVTSTEFNFLSDVENVEIENVVRLTTFFLSTGVDSVKTLVSDKQRRIAMMRVASGLFETRGLPVPCCMAAGPDSSVTKRKQNCRMCHGFSFWWFNYFHCFRLEAK